MALEIILNTNHTYLRHDEDGSIHILRVMQALDTIKNSLANDDVEGIVRDYDTGESIGIWSLS